MSGHGAAAKIAALYTLFAIIATAVNLATQWVSLLIIRAWLPGLEPWAVYLGLVAGTGTGLIVKYVLDKRWIFRFQTRDLKHDAGTFALYTVMSLVTTVVFWGFELGFHALFDTPWLTYLGGAIGLAIGYVVKYALDKRFVFPAERSAA